MAHIIDVLPELRGNEQIYIQQIINDMTPETAAKFAMTYRVRRKDPQSILLMTLIGFVFVAGIQRFMVEQYVLGILYLLTFGFCYIGTIIDVVIHQQIALEYNQRQAHEVLQMLRSSGSVS